MGRRPRGAHVALSCQSPWPPARGSGVVSHPIGSRQFPHPDANFGVSVVLRRVDLRLVALLGAALVALALWSLLVPAWESSDEPDHWQYAAYIHQHAALPPYDRQFREGNEPPLYYLLMSPVTGTGGAPGQALGRGADGREHYINLPRLYPTSQHDLRDYAGLHIGRLLTCLVSLGTVWFTFLAGRVATGRRETGFLAAALVAFLPQFSARGSTFSTDALVTAVCAAGTWLIIRLWRHGYSHRLGAAIGVVGGLAILSKVTGVVLFAGFVVAVAVRRDVPWRSRVMRLWPIAVSLLIASPWLIHNQITYGDPLDLKQVPVAVGDLFAPHALLSGYFAGAFPLTLAQSFVGLFGWTNVPMPPAYYAAYAMVLCLVIAGCCRAIRESSEIRGLMTVLLAITVAAFLIVVDINLTFTQPQGRYMFAALSAIAVLAALGLEATPGWTRHALKATTIGAGFLFVLDVALLPLVIIPAYGVHW